MNIKINESFVIHQPKFHKVYANKSEELKAATLVHNEFVKVREFNKKFDKGTVSFRRKLWKHSDCSAAKRKRLHSGFRHGNKLKRRYKRDAIKYPEGPASFDWRNFSVLTPVQDQGFTCSSCYAFATTGALEALFARSTNQLVKLSEQQIIDCNFNAATGNWGCDVTIFQAK